MPSGPTPPSGWPTPDAAKDLIKQRINPSHHRKDERQKNINEAEARKRAMKSSFAKVSAAYVADAKSHYTEGSYRTKESRIRKFLSPKLDTLPINEIGPNEIRPILLACKEHGAWAGIHVKGDLSAIFEYAVVHGLADLNPIRYRFGENLRAVVEHLDESHPHVHFFVVDPIAAAKGMVNPVLQRKTYTEAMRTFLDEYWGHVGGPTALARIGPRRRRLTRDEWAQEQGTFELRLLPCSRFAPSWKRCEYVKSASPNSPDARSRKRSA